MLLVRDSNRLVAAAAIKSPEHPGERGRAHQREPQRLRRRAPHHRDGPGVDAVAPDQAEPRPQPADARSRSPRSSSRTSRARAEGARQEQERDGRGRRRPPSSSSIGERSRRSSALPIPQISPVAQVASRSERTAWTTSSGVPKRPSGERVARRWVRSGSASASGSATIPSATRLMRTSGASSTASARSPVASAPLAVRYATWFMNGRVIPASVERDDRPLRASEIRRERVNEEQRGDGMNSERPLEIFAPERLERRPREGPAGEDDVVQLGSLRSDPADDPLDRVAVREVRGDDGDAGPGARVQPRDVRREGLELVRIPGGQDRLVAPRGETVRDRRAKAAGGANHEHMTTTLHHGFLYSAPRTIGSKNRRMCSMRGYYRIDGPGRQRGERRDGARADFNGRARAALGHVPQGEAGRSARARGAPSRWPSMRPRTPIA